MKKNLLLFVGLLVLSYILRQVELSISYANLHCYQDGLTGESGVCYGVLKLNYWLAVSSVALMFASLIFVPVLLKHNNWVKWIGAISAIYAFLPFERISSMINHLAWTINPQWFINKEETANTDFYYNYWAKWMDAFRFVENNWFWIILGAVIVLSLVSIDRKKNGIITRFFTRLTEPA